MNNKHSLLHLMRLGIHAEQKYFINRPQLYDVLVLNGNIVEYFAKGTASLMAGPLRERPYFIDPITHSFGHNPRYIMTYDENRKPKGVKKSLQLVAESYGPPIVDVIQDERAISPTDLEDFGLMKEFTERVVNFQSSRLSNALEEDTKYLDNAELPRPLLFVAPYFYMDVSNFSNWLPVNLSLIKVAKDVEPESQVFGEIVIDRGILDDTEIWQAIAEAYVAIEECDGFLIWISDFSEHEASKSQLVNMRQFVEHLARKEKPVYNLYGGYYSILLYHHGLAGVCHGPGYGEDRHVVPVGGGIPRPKYYLTPIHERQLHSDVQILIDQGAWTSIEDFYREVCNSEICQTVLDGDLKNFYRFGKVEPRQRKDGVYYNVPLPETIEIMNFHYLEAKANEFAKVVSTDIVELTQQMKDAHKKYRKFMPESQLRHLTTWAEIISS